MLSFQNISYKNFLSSGDRGINISFNTFSTNLIVGENGTGKSTILDALTFALYGKGFRNVTKSQLMNTINDKDCRVELDFINQGKQYKIIRGMKPTIFEIHCDGILVNQDASSRDYQKYLENNILKMNEKSFRQIVVLGSADYIPFMQLKSQDRRSIIEDLLDINIFSDMNKLLKEKIANLKLDVLDKEHKLDLAEQGLESFKQFEQDDAKRTQNQIDIIDQEIQKHIQSKTVAEKELVYIQECLKKLSYDEKKHLHIKKQINDINKLLTQAETKKSVQTKLQNFFEHNNSCPSCKQGIQHSHKTLMIEEASNEINVLEEAEKKLSAMLESITKKLQNTEKTLSQINKLKTDITLKQQFIQMNNNYIESCENNKSKVLNQKNNSSKPKKLQLVMDLKNAESLMNEVKKELDYHNIAATILKDDGIKTRIIRQFLPIMNQLINKYLTTLGLSVDFHLDEKFDETIKSRYRDVFSYASFSEGEKARIDISIMLAWRAIAKMKNSADTNLLILDETFDGSLDSNATDELLSILGELEKTTNIFVISHRNDSLYDKFKNLIEFEKVNNFSQIKTKSEDDENRDN